MRIVPFTTRPRWRPLARFAVAGFILSFTVHALTYVGVAAQEYSGAVWALHIGIFPLFFPFVWQLRHWREGRRLNWRPLLRYVPRWAYVVVPVLFVYAFVNFMIATSHVPPGPTPISTASDGLTHEERVYLLRAFSGHWLIFYAVPALYFLFVPSTATSARDDDGPPGRAAA